MQTTRIIFLCPKRLQKVQRSAHRIGVRILFSRVGNGVGKAVENVPIPFIYNARVSLGGNQLL
jgi:hypothetical protein